MGEWQAALARLEHAPEAVRQEWVHGLAMNPAAPVSVLTRILALDPLPRDGHWLVWRNLPPEVAAAAVTHANRNVWQLALENPEVRRQTAALVARDPDPRKRRLFAFVADFDSLPDDVAETLLTDPDPGVRRAARGLRLSLALERRLAANPDPELRSAALSRQFWEQLTAEERTAFLTDSDPSVREAAERLARPAEPALPRTPAEYRAETDTRRRHRAAGQAALDRELAELLVMDLDPTVRWSVAGNPHLPTDLALRLGEDPDERVRLDVSLRQDLTDEQRAAIAYIVPGGYCTIPWVHDRHTDADAMRALARSSHVLIRRNAAMARTLPADVVALLAEDEDFFVRLTLAEYCDDAPHELLVEMYTYWHGLRWGVLMYRPNFAKPGLARFADHPDHRLRRAALHDPDATPELVQRLTHDPTVGTWAARDPRLPLDRLPALLGEGGQPVGAAANPNLPPELMHRLLDLAGVPAGR